MLYVICVISLSQIYCTNDLRWNTLDRFPGSLKPRKNGVICINQTKKKGQLMQEKKTEETTCHLLTPFLLKSQQKNKAFRFNNMNITISKDLILSNKHKPFMLQGFMFPQKYDKGASFNTNQHYEPQNYKQLHISTAFTQSIEYHLTNSFNHHNDARSNQSYSSHLQPKHSVSYCPT